MPIASPEVYADMLDRAKAGRFAYPAINVTSSQTLNAALQGFADAGSDGIIQFSTGGAEFGSGLGIKEMVIGAVALAEFGEVRDGKTTIIENDEKGRRVETTNVLLADKLFFSAHLLNLSTEGLGSVGELAEIQPDRRTHRGGNGATFNKSTFHTVRPRANYRFDHGSRVFNKLLRSE